MSTDLRNAQDMITNGAHTVPNGKIDVQVERNFWLDVAKGVAILLVVFGHTSRGLYPTGIMSFEAFHAIDSRIYAFHMPVFFIISGMVFVRSSQRFAFVAYLRRLLHRLIWPMIVWTYIFLLTKYVAGALSNTPIDFSDVLVSPFPGQLHFWFIWALFLMSLCLWPFSRGLAWGGNRNGLLVVAGVGALGLALLPLPSQLGYWFGSAAANMPFFYCGIVLTQLQVLRRISPPIGAAAAVCFVVLIVKWPILSDTIHPFFVAFALSNLFLVGFAGIIQSRKSNITATLAVLGQQTLTIYVAHTIFSAAFREGLFVIGVDALWLHLIVGNLVGVCGPLLLLIVAKRTDTQRLLGL